MFIDPARENGSRPAYPMDEKTMAEGLTKKEIFSVIILNGLLSADCWSLAEEERGDLARRAVANADRLLVALETQEQS